ncbi:MAG: 50S ribosomal protein L2 [Candidatus Norongarragalinales archaeon]
MGTRLRQQKRGRGSPVFRSPGHRFLGDIRYDVALSQTLSGVVSEFLHDPARDVLVAEITLENGRKVYNLAAEGLAIGDRIQIGREAQPGLGNVALLKNIPDGTSIFNVELRPGDGGKLSRSSGTFCFKLAEDEDTGMVSVQLSSKEVKNLSPNCFATIGIASGGGRLEKPFLKASAKRFKMQALNRYYPHVRGRAMSAYDHPYGGKTGGKPTTVSHGTPVGRKAGHIGARRTGRSKGKGVKSNG